MPVDAPYSRDPAQKLFSLGDLYRTRADHKTLPPAYVTASGIEPNSYADQPRASHGVRLADRGGPSWEGHYNYMMARSRRKDLDKLAARQRNVEYFSSDSDDENDSRGRPPRASDYRKDAGGRAPYGTTQRSILMPQALSPAPSARLPAATSASGVNFGAAAARQVANWCYWVLGWFASFFRTEG